MAIGQINTRKRFNHKVRPQIKVKFNGLPASEIPAELIPMLVEGSTYENKKRFSPEGREIRKVSLEDYKGKIKDQNGKVVFIYDCGRCHIAISAIELARVLYLHNTHLTRTALRPNGLQGLATVEEGQNTSNITFHKLSDFPASSLRLRSSQAHLIWLLFDEAARRGFNSIYESLLQCEEHEWPFDFTPPSLKGWIAQVAVSVGKVDEDIPYVGEITAIHNPSFEYQNEVVIRHPSLKETIRVDPEDKARPVVVKPDQDSQLDLESIPKVSRRRDVVSEAGFRFTFGSDITSKLAPDKREHKVSSVVTSDGKKSPEKTGVGHGSRDGTSQELDFGINRSEELPEDLKDAEGTSRFTLFEEVITQLTSLEGYQNLATKCLELPKPRTPRKAYTNQNTENPRVCHAAYIRYFGLPLLIVEVDMDDNPKRSLSTRIFGFRNDRKKGFRDIMQSCSDDGVYWNTEVINRVCGVTTSAKHPHREMISKYEEGKRARTPLEYKGAWVSTLDRAVRRARLQVDNKIEV